MVGGGKKMGEVVYLSTPKVTEPWVKEVSADERVLWAQLLRRVGEIAKRLEGSHYDIAQVSYELDILGKSSRTELIDLIWQVKGLWVTNLRRRSLLHALIQKAEEQGFKPLSRSSRVV